MRTLAALRRLPRPHSFVSRVVNQARRVGGASTAMDLETKRFVEHNKRVWKEWAIRDSDAVILADFYTIAETNIARSYFLNVLARKHGATIMSVQGYGGDQTLHRVYQSFNTAEHLVPVLTGEQERRRSAMTCGLWPALRSKQDVFDLTVSGIWIGVDIYESYLRDYNKPTVDLGVPQLRAVVDRAVGLVVFWQDVFSSPRRVAAVVASHDCYVDAGVLCKVAWAHGVPVYSPNPIYVTCARQPHSCHSHFPRYRELFRRLTPEEQEQALSLAREQLQRRLNGEVGVDMPYSTKSAFGPSGDSPALKRSEKIKVLICTHCFFDNPHAFGGMLFVDFVEWLRYLGAMSERTDYEWYIKTHPDPLPGTLETIRDILRDFPRITLVPAETSHRQLAAEGLDFALTVYGSVGHEYPALGVQVINAGYNPRIAYDFNWHAGSLAEYESYLMNLKTLKKTIDPEDLAEFYYMHHHYQYDDDFVFTSYRQMKTAVAGSELTGSAAYKYFLDQFSEDKHHAIIQAMEAFIDSGKSHYFSHGPV